MPKQKKYIRIKATDDAVARGLRIPRPLAPGMPPRRKDERFYNSNGKDPGGPFERWVEKDSHHLRLKVEGAIEILEEIKQDAFDAKMAETAPKPKTRRKATPKPPEDDS